MLRTTALPQAAAEQPELTRHEAAAEHDYAGALEWLEVIEAIGDRLPEEHERKRATWALAQGRVP